jgi:two-component system response regulator RegA
MKTVLVVEDDAVYRSVVGRTLTRAGYTAVLAETAQQALSEACTHPPDVAVVDLRLPDGSGIDVVRGLAELAPGCRCVMLSGHGTIPDAVEAMRRGAVDFLTKPVSAAELTASVTDALEPLPRESLEQVERNHILSVLQACGGNITEAARRLGLYRRTLQRKLQKLPPAR